jgi:hypothetical protein
MHPNWWFQLGTEFKLHSACCFLLLWLSLRLENGASKSSETSVNFYYAIWPQILDGSIHQIPTMWSLFPCNCRIYSCFKHKLRKYTNFCLVFVFASSGKKTKSLNRENHFYLCCMFRIWNSLKPYLKTEVKNIFLMQSRYVMCWSNPSLWILHTEYSQFHNQWDQRLWFRWVTLRKRHLSTVHEEKLNLSELDYECKLNCFKFVENIIHWILRKIVKSPKYSTSFEINCEKASERHI